MTLSPTQVTYAVSSEFENVKFKEGNLTAFFPSPKFSGFIDGKIFFHLKQIKDDKLRVALGKFGLWKENIRVKYSLNEENPEKPAADHIMLLEDKPSTPETVEIHTGVLVFYGKGYGMIREDKSEEAHRLEINAVIDECLKRYLQDPPSSINKSVQFILHWNKNKEGKINQVIHSLILAEEERIALNKEYGLTESTVQPKLMSPESLPDYEPLSPIHSTIRTDNIFRVDGIVEGESLIGYKEKYKELREKILDERKNLLFVGLPKTGKTSLIKKLHQEAKSNKKIIEIFISNLQDFASKENPFAAFLFDIVEKIRNELNKHNNLNTKIVGEFYASFDELQKCYVSHNYEKRFQDTFKRLFQKIKNLDIHVLLSVDEFDSAEKIFKDTADYTIFDTLANSKYAINIVFISNLPEKRSNENVSTQRELSISYGQLKLIYEEFSKDYNVSISSKTMTLVISLNGYNDNDQVKGFSDILEKAYGIYLSNAQLAQIKYYAGYSPYIYSAFCHYIVKEKLQNGKNSFDIEKIYKDNVKSIIDDYTEVLYTLLKNNGYLKKINNILFDPENCNEELNDIKYFTSIGYLKKCNLKGERHQVLSSYFTDYLRKQYLSQYSSKNIAKNILNLHRLIKVMILKSFRDLTEDEWIKVMKKVYRKIRDIEFNSDCLSCSIKKNKTSFEECNKESALFNALPLRSVFYILQAYWQPIFKKYFNEQEYSYFEEDFELCAKIRDDICHANENFIKEEKIREIVKVNRSCIEVLKLVGKKWQMGSIEFDPLTLFV